MISTVARYLLLPLVLGFFMPAASSGAEQKLTVDGMEVYYGIKSVNAKRTEEDTSSMHKGLVRKHRRHLTVALIDAKTQQHISDATIDATVTPLGLGATKKRLKPIRVNENVTYDNFFELPPDSAPFRIVLTIDRPHHSTQNAAFEYRP